VNQQPGETRLALLQRNAEIFAGIIPPIVRAARDAIILIATNPLDIMTQIATKLAVQEGMPASRVLGTGTMLDTGRFRTLLGQRYNVAPSSVHAYVLGEHGDSEVLNWSGASVAGVPLEQFALASGQPLSAEIMQQVDQDVRRAAYKIIAGKGSTYYGIGAAIAALSRCILFDERSVFTASSVMTEVEGVTDVALSLPHIIGRKGIEMTILPTLNAEEHAALNKARPSSKRICSRYSIKAVLNKLCFKLTRARLNQHAACRAKWLRRRMMIERFRSGHARSTKITAADGKLAQQMRHIHQPLGDQMADFILALPYSIHTQ
jgi:L-lactate dehydrogenase